MYRFLIPVWCGVGKISISEIIVLNEVLRKNMQKGHIEGIFWREWKNRRNRGSKIKQKGTFLQLKEENLTKIPHGPQA